MRLMPSARKWTQNPCMPQTLTGPLGPRPGGVGRLARGLSILAVGLTLSAPACNDTTSPTPTSKPAVPFPSGTPEATALENLALVRNLEAKARGEAMILVLVTTNGVSTLGRTAPGHSSWYYDFAETVGSNPNVDRWLISPGGSVEFQGSIHPDSRLVYRELLPDLRSDSDRVAALALQYGGQTYVDEYPGATMAMYATWEGGRPVWSVTIQDVRAAPYECREEFVFDGGTGAILSHTPAFCV